MPEEGYRGRGKVAMDASVCQELSCLVLITVHNVVAAR